VPTTKNTQSYSPEYFLSFSDGTLSRKLLEFSKYSKEEKWTPKNLDEHISKHIYHSRKDAPHYYLGYFNVRDFLEFSLTKEGKQAIELIKKELTECFSQLKNWAKQQQLKVDIRQRAFSVESILIQFYKRLIDNEFFGKNYLFYSDGKKAIEVITLLVNDNTIDLTFRQNQLLTLTGDENLMHCAEGCYTHIMKTARALQDYSDMNLPSLIKKFIRNLAQETILGSPPLGKDTYPTRLCVAAGIPIEAYEIHAHNYLMNQLSGEIAIKEFEIEDFYTHSFEIPAVRPICLEFISDIKQQFRANTLVQFIIEQYLQQEITAWTVDFKKLDYFLNLFGKDSEFNWHQILNFIEESNKIILKNQELFAITIAERLINSQWFSLDKDSRLTDLFHLINPYFIQKNIPYNNLIALKNSDCRIFTGNLALSWIKKEDERMDIVSILANESNPIEILKKYIPKEQLMALLENWNDIFLFFSKLSYSAHGLAIDWFIESGFDLRVTFFRKLALLKQLNSVPSEIDNENYQLIFNFNKLFRILNSETLESILSRFNLNPFIQELLIDNINARNLMHKQFYEILSHFIQNIAAAGFQNYKQIIFHDPTSDKDNTYLRNIDFLNSYFEHVYFKTFLENVSFKESTFKSVYFYSQLEQIKLEQGQGDITIFGTIQHSIISNFDGYLSLSHINNLQIKRFFGSIKIKGQINEFFLENSYLEKIIIEGDISNSRFFQVNLKRLEINGKIIRSSYAYSDFRNTRFLPIFHDRFHSSYPQVNIVTGEFYFPQEINTFFYRSKFSTQSVKDLLNYPTLQSTHFYLFRSADLREVDFTDTELQFSLNKYETVDFNHANLEKINFDNFMRFPSNTIIKFNQALLKAASFQGANLLKVDLSAADLTDCDLSTAFLDSAKLGKAIIVNVKMQVDQLFQFYDQGHRDFSTIRLVGTLSPIYQKKDLFSAFLSPQAFEYLITQGFKNFRQTNLRIIPKEIYMQYQLRKDLIFKYAILPLKFSYEHCLDIRSRNKREEVCLFGWEDVDNFNLEKQELRNLHKVRIDSQHFLNFFKKVPGEKRQQLIEFASNYPLVGPHEQTMKLNQLIQLSAWRAYLNRVSRIANQVNAGLLVKDTLIDFLKGDYPDTAINLGFTAAGPALAQLSKILLEQAKFLELEGKLLLSNALKISSPFLARGTSAYIIYDLIQAIDGLDAQDETALRRVIDDVLFISMDLLEIGAEYIEVYELLEGVASITGEIGAVVKSVIFIHAEIYRAVQQVKQIHALVPLTQKEAFYELIHAIFRMDISPHLQKTMLEKQLVNQLVDQAFLFLEKHPEIKHYVFTKIKRVENCFPTSIHKFDFLGRIIVVPSKTCQPYLSNNLHNYIDLAKENYSKFWSRTSPLLPSWGGKLLCFKSEQEEENKYLKSLANLVEVNYLCTQAIGVTETYYRTGDYTLIDVAEGWDDVEGFPESPNIIVAQKGKKRLKGGEKDDIFILQGDGISGVIDGMGGINTLELGQFEPNQTLLSINLIENSLSYNEPKSNANDPLFFNHIQQILGRQTKNDKIICACDTRYVDGRGGIRLLEKDSIIVANNVNCDYQMQIKVEPFTEILNDAERGNFSYWVARGNGRSDVHLLQQNSYHQVFFNYSLSEIQEIKFLSDESATLGQQISFYFNAPEFNKNSNQGIFHILFTFTNQTEVIYYLKDETNIKLGQKRIYLVQNSQSAPSRNIPYYLEIANRLKAIIMVKSAAESLLIGTSEQDILQNDPLCPSHLVGNANENIYKIIPKTDSYRIPDVNIYYAQNSTKIQTLDLRAVVDQFEKHNGCPINLEIEESKGNLHLFVNSAKECHQHQKILEIIFHGAHHEGWFNQINIIARYSFSEVTKQEKDKLTWILKPRPLIWDETKRVLVIKAQDVEPFTSVIIPEKAPILHFVRGGESLADLVVVAKMNEPFFHAIIFEEFFEESKLAQQVLGTVSIQYHDKLIEIGNYAHIDAEFIPSITELYRNIQRSIYQSIGLSTRTRRVTQGLPKLSRLIPFKNLTVKSVQQNCENIFRFLEPLYSPFIQAYSQNEDKWPHYFLENVSKVWIDDKPSSFKPKNLPQDKHLVVYQAKLRTITLEFSLFSVVYGSVSASLEEMLHRYPSAALKNFFNYGIKPILLAAPNVDLDDPFQLLIYLLTYFITKQLHDSLQIKFYEKIQNKIINFFLPLVLSMFIFNPLLWKQENAFEAYVSFFCNSLLNGLLFKAGEWGAKKTIGQFFTSDRVNKQRMNEEGLISSANFSPTLMHGFN